MGGVGRLGGVRKLGGVGRLGEWSAELGVVKGEDG